MEVGWVLKRTIKSFVNRAGRITSAQRRAIEKFLLDFSLRSQLSFQGENVFLKHRPLYLEIGFGNGLNLVKQAEYYPGRNFIGCEIYESGIGNTLINLKNRGINNVRIAVGDALETIDYLSLKSLDGVFILFPDPWPKKRHNKRRLVNKDFLEKIGPKMKDHAKIFMTTDDRSYAQEIIEVLAEDAFFENIAGKRSFAPRPSWRESTKFEERAHRLGNSIFEIIACLKN